MRGGDYRGTHKGYALSCFCMRRKHRCAYGGKNNFTDYSALSCLILGVFSITQDCVRVIIINWESVVYGDREQKESAVVISPTTQE